MKWHILGPGAIGSLIAARLCVFAHDQVTLIFRNIPPFAHGENRKHGQFPAVLLDKEGKPQEYSVHVLTNWIVEDNEGPIDNLIVATKAHQAVTAMNSISHRLGTHSRILLLFNGMGIHEEILQSWMNKRMDEQNCPQWLTGIVTFSALRTNNHQILQTGTGSMWFAPLKNTCTPPTDLWNHFRRANLNVHLLSSLEFRQKQWEKLIINCCINPVAALLQCSNGTLLKTEESQKLIRQLIEEAYPVMYAETMENRPLESMVKAVHQVIQQTAQNRCSTLQDMDRREKTEMDYITGYLVKTAHHHGIAVPSHEVLLRMIHVRESIY